MANPPIEQQLACRYAQIVDDREFSRMAEIMVPDFTLEGPGFGAASLADFIDSLGLLEQRFDATFHLVGNQLGRWQGDDYEGETYCVASHLYQKEGVARKLDMGIRYREAITRHQGVFKYRYRNLNVVWQQDLPLVG